MLVSYKKFCFNILLEIKYRLSIACKVVSLQLSLVAAHAKGLNWSTNYNDYCVIYYLLS